MVHSIDWLDDKGQLAYVETYNDYGKLYTREYYKNNNSLITIYYNKSGQEYAQTVPKSSGIMIINHPQVSGYYANRLTLLTDYLKQNGISDKLVLLDSNLIEDANQAIDCINLNDCRTLRDLVGTNNQLEMIYDFSDSSQRLVDSYIKVVKPRTESSLVKTIFILSASDELEMIEELIEGLQEYHFMIGARTMVSQKFLNLGRNKNVTISAHMSKLDVERALQKCEFYLDINHFFEVDYILSRAILYDIPVLSFRDIAHQKAYFYPETIFDKNQIVNFRNVNSIDTFIVSTDLQKQKFTETVYKESGVRPNVQVIPVGSVDLKEPSHHQRKHFSMMTASRLQARKRVDWLIRAAILAKKDIPQLEFSIYGRGSEQEKLENIINEHNAQNYIFLKGHADLDDVYPQYELYVSASSWETFGLSLLEAVSHGLAMIGLNVPYGNPTFIESDSNGFLVDYEYLSDEQITIQALADKIITYFKLPETVHQSFNDKSFEIAEQFTKDKVKQVWLELLEN